MIAKLEFNLPEDDSLFQDYQDGIKCKYLLHGFIQDWEKRIENSNKVINAEVLLKDLREGLLDSNVDLYR